MVWEKPLEGELADYRFNSSGYRNDRDFGPKQSGTFRIVMLGTSMATGLRMPQEKTFATLLPAELSQRTGRKVELYNLGLPWRSPDGIAQHLDEAIALKPDMILWVITPKDVWNKTWVVPKYPDREDNFHEGLWVRFKAAITPRALLARASFYVVEMRTVTMLRHSCKEARVCMFRQPSRGPITATSFSKADRARAGRDNSASSMPAPPVSNNSAGTQVFRSLPS